MIFFYFQEVTKNKCYTDIYYIKFSLQHYSMDIFIIGIVMYLITMSLSESSSFKIVINKVRKTQFTHYSTNKQIFKKHWL